MAFTQQTFLGASITNFTANIGWDGSNSNLMVGLVEDPLNNDKFVRVDTGTPAVFQYDTFSFQGIVQKWSKRRSSDGFRYEVNLVSPDELLDGTQLILSDYTLSTSGVPNIIGVFPYLESGGEAFGNSNVNETGIPWITCKNAIVDIINKDNLIYGGRIQYKGKKYKINLDGLPPVSPSYRVSGKPNITLLNFVQDIAEAGHCKFFTQLIGDTIYVITRNFDSKIPESAAKAVSQFLDTVSGYILLEDGIEFKNDTVGKFLVGGKQKREWFLEFSPSGGWLPTDLFYDSNNDGELDSLGSGGFLDSKNLNIAQFWGYDINRKMIFPNEYINKWVQYLIPDLDVRHIDIPGLKDTYTTSYGELLAALDSRESWEFFLVENGASPYFIDDTGADKNTVLNPYYTLATRLKIIGNLCSNLKNLFKNKTKEELENINPVDFAGITLSNSKYADKTEEEVAEENGGKLYNFLRNYAEEYYGRKFVVTLPETKVKLDSDTLVVTTSEIPTDGGYLNDNDIKYLQNTDPKTLPIDITRLSLDDGRIECFVRYDSAGSYNLDQMSPEDYIISDYVFTGNNNKVDGKSIFIKARALDKVVFTAYSPTDSGYDIPLNIDDPRAIIELSTRLRQKDLNFVSASGALGPYFKQLEHILLPILVEKEVDNPQAILQKTFSSIGADILYLGEVTPSDIPSGVGLPLESQILTYGPWFNYGAQGRMDFEQDETLVPWNYNSISGMNMVGQAKVDTAVSKVQYVEMGTIELDGTPISGLTLGGSLVPNMFNQGPYITDIVTNIGEGGITTTYRFQIFTDRFGRVAQQNQDRFKQIEKRIQQVRRRIQEESKIPGKNDIYYKMRQLDRGVRTQSRSSHHVMCGEVIGISPSSNFAIVTQPTYNTIGQLHNNYHNKAVASLDSLFIPFSTDTNYSGNFPSGMLPHFEMPAVSGSGLITANNLNPYISGHNIGIITRDNEFTASGIITRQFGYASGNIYRALAYRNPMIIGGWGYDTNGDPVPYITVNSSGIADPSGTKKIFDPNYLQDTSKWKVGPLDLRWENDRKVWIGGANLLQGFMDEKLLAPSGYITSSGFFGKPIYTSGYVRLFNWSGDTLIEGAKKLVYNVDKTLAIDSGTYVQLAEVGGRLMPIWVAAE